MFGSFSWRLSSNKSDLFSTIVLFFSLLIFFQFLASKTSKTMSADLPASSALFTPSCSISSSACLSPAVSRTFIGKPSIVMFSETMSLVVPALLLTIALSLPQILLKSDDFPTFGSPIIVITSPFLTLIPILVCSISFSKLSFASSSMDKSVSGCLVSSRS